MGKVSISSSVSGQTMSFGETFNIKGAAKPDFEDHVFFDDNGKPHKIRRPGAAEGFGVDCNLAFSMQCLGMKCVRVECCLGPVR